MKALVKAEAEPGLWMRGRRRSPTIGPNDVLIQIAQDRDLRHRHAHLQLGRLGAEDHSRCRWSSATSSAGEIVELGSEVARLRGRRARLRRGPHHLRPLPQLPRRPPPPLPQHRRRRRQPPGLLRRVPGHPGRQRLQAAATRSPTTSPRSSIRFGNATHTALSFDLVGEDVLITGAGPDRHHGRGDRPPRRRAPRRHHRRQRLPARPGAQDGRHARGQRRAARRSTT